MSAVEISYYLFAIFNCLRVVSYLPQIWRVANDDNRATAISYWTWGLWTAANASTAFYAATNLGDQMLTFVSASNAFCCALVICLTNAKRRGLGLRRRIQARLRAMRGREASQAVQ